MDTKGHWHNEDSEAMKAFKAAERAGRAAEVAQPERPVISIGIGEVVQIVRNGGEFLTATFDAAEKNKVTLTPQAEMAANDRCCSGPVYLELAETVQIQRSNGENVRAQVWDNRGGKIILRTLPV